MRIKLPHAPYIARKIANDLFKSGFIKFKSGTEPIVAVAQDILYADINKERALEERVKELLEQNENEIDFMQVDRKSMFWLIKKKLAKDFGVMLAYDDAIHGIMGKAGANRIFELPREKTWIKAFFEKNPCVYFENNGFDLQASRIKEMMTQMGLCIEMREKPGPGVTTVSLCESIFSIEDMSLSKVYLDLSDCIFATEEDMLDVINYGYSKRSFVFGQKPIFLENIRRLRERKTS